MFKVIILLSTTLWKQEVSASSLTRLYALAWKCKGLLLERLLDHRERLLNSNYPDRPKSKEGKTNLTKMLLNKAPPKDDVSAIVDDNATKIQLKAKGLRAEIMVGYKENFVVAYRKCQDQPGGKFEFMVSVKL